MTKHKDWPVCRRTAEAAWSRKIQYEADAKKQDTQLLSWCCPVCLDQVRRHQFGYMVVISRK